MVGFILLSFQCTVEHRTLKQCYCSYNLGLFINYLRQQLNKYILYALYMTNIVIILVIFVSLYHVTH